MSILDTFLKTKKHLKDENYDDEAVSSVDQLHDQIILNERMLRLVGNEDVKALLKDVHGYLSRVDEALMDEQIALEHKRNLLCMKKCWTTVLRILCGAKNNLEVIEKQLQTLIGED